MSSDKSLKDNSIYRWVKASERLPEFGKETWMRIEGLVATGAFFKDGESMVLTARGFDDISPSDKYLTKIEWLEKVEADQDTIWNEIYFTIDGWGGKSGSVLKQKLMEKYFIIPKQ